MLWNMRKRHRKSIKENFGAVPSDCDRDQMRGRMDRIMIYHNEMEEQKDGYWIDPVTWDDLEMDEVFFRMNHTASYIGEQVLYHQLHCIDTDRKKEERLEQQIIFYREHEEERLDMEEDLSFIGKRNEDYYMPQFLMHSEFWHIQNGLLLRMLQIVLFVCLGGTLYTKNEVFIAGLMIVAVINLLIYIILKRKYEIFLYSLGSLKQLLRFCRRMLAFERQENFPVPEEVIRTINEMEGLSRKIIGWQTRKYAAFSGDIMYLVQDYLFGITLLDISMFNRIMKGIDAKQDQIMKLYEFAGQIDMGISIASFRDSLPFYCLPKREVCDTMDVGGKDTCVSVKKLIHPLVTDAVENDFVLNRRALITGANASGKSTFMKALAINVILAQTIHTCTAQEFSAPQLFVITSMSSLRDCVLTGESYYMREARRLKQMLEQAGCACPKLLVMDEILKGTNTTERLAASSAVLDYAAGLPDFVLAATHDRQLVRDMGTKYENFHFESIMTDTDIIFTYRILKGQGGDSNAIGLLALLDYPKEIILAAKKRMKKYENW